MPAIYQCDFVVRQYECDGYGHLNNVNYVRWMQEAALGATASVGWTMERYTATGTQWVIRETDIEYLVPVRYGDTVTITTWIDDFRKVRSYRRYEFRRTDGTLIARAVTDWVYIDIATGKPTQIPPDMIIDFRPEGSPPTAPRTAFAAPPAAPSDVFTLARRVEWRDVDVQGHANNATYLTYIEDTFNQVVEHYGWGVARLQALGIAAFVRRLRVQYLRAAYLNEVIHVDTYLSEVRRASFTRHYLLRRPHDNAVIAQANALCVFCDIATGQPVRAPHGIKEAFSNNIAGN